MEKEVDSVSVESLTELLPKKRGTKIPIVDQTSSQKISDDHENDIKTLDEYVSKVQDLKEQGFSFYRGDKFYDIANIELVPKVYKRRFSNVCKCHDDAVKEFAELTTCKIPIPSSGFLEDMINAEHYGLPTRLLDWSESAMIALYFAVFPSNQANGDKPQDSIVWLLNPTLLNAKSKHSGIRSIDKKDSGEITSYYNSEKMVEGDKYPLAIRTRKINPRIEAQQGVFVLFCKNDSKQSLHLMPESEKFLRKITISNEYARKIYKSLVSLGVTQYSIFPEPQSISQDIIDRITYMEGDLV